MQAVLLIFLGTAIARLSMTDLYLRYVKEALRPFLLATAVVLLMLGGWALWDIVRGRDSVAEDDDAGAEAHDGHDHGKMRIAWLLTLPVFAIMLIAPPALGAYSAERETSTAVAPSDDLGFEALPAGDPIVFTLNEFTSRAVWDTPGTLGGRTFRLTGFVTNVPTAKLPNDLPAGSQASWWLTRLSLSCCAADARAAKVLAVDGAPLPSNTWVTVTGTWIPGGGTDSVSAIPWLRVESVEQIREPKDPYE